MTCADQIDDILFALGPGHPSNALVLSIALHILADHITDAEFESGMKLRDLSDVRVYLLELADAAQAKTKTNKVGVGA